MKETAKALVSKNQNELLAARTIEVSLDRADNVIEGGTHFRTTQTYAVEFPGAPLFAPLFHAKGGGLEPPRSTNIAAGECFTAGLGAFRLCRGRDMETEARASVPASDLQPLTV